MQIIYIDSLLCVNLFIDYIIIYTIKKTLHIHAKGIRVLFGSLFGAICTLGVFLPFYKGFFSLAYRIITALIIILISFGYSSARKLIIRSLAYFIISLLFCGAIFLIELIVNLKGVIVYNDAVYFDISPITLILTTLAAYFGISVYEKLSNNHKIKSQLFRVTVYTEENLHINFETMLDTGCNLKEPFSGLPVIVVEKGLFENVDLPKNKMRIIPFSTASGDSILYGFRPMKIIISGKEIENGCYIGLCENKLQGEIKSIMGTELAENL